MKLNAEKKHSVRYDAIDDKAAITSVYVMKTALNNKVPQIINIKLEIPNE